MVARKKPVAAATSSTSTSNEERSAIHASLDELLNKSPTRARLVVAFVSAFCSGVAFGWLAGMAVEFLAVSALVLTGSAFLAAAVWLLSWCMAFYAFIFHTPNVGEWIINRGPDRAWNKTREFFSAKTDAASSWLAQVARPSNFTVH
jgi:hypothetical protein